MSQKLPIFPTVLCGEMSAAQNFILVLSQIPNSYACKLLNKICNFLNYYTIRTSLLPNLKHGEMTVDLP